MGVPTEGVIVASARSAAAVEKPRVGELSSIATSGGEELSGGDAYGLRTVVPRMASARAGSYKPH